MSFRKRISDKRAARLPSMRVIELRPVNQSEQIYAAWTNHGWYLIGSLPGEDERGYVLNLYQDDSEIVAGPFSTLDEAKTGYQYEPKEW